MSGAAPGGKRPMAAGDYASLPPNKKHLAAWKPSAQRESLKIVPVCGWICLSCVSSAVSAVFSSCSGLTMGGVEDGVPT
jgi:hypothetical protein